MRPFSTGRQQLAARHYVHAGSPRLQRTAMLAAQDLDFPWAQINIVDHVYQHTVAEYGLTSHGPMPREHCVCRHVVDTARPLAVGDLAADDRFATLPAVSAGLVRSYLGVPLLGREASVVGTLCLLDPAPRRIAAGALERLRAFGDIVEDQLELGRRTHELRQCAQPSAAELVRAIDDGALVPWYQPIVDLGTGATLAYEALARWIGPDGGVQRPAGFLRVAEDSDLIVDLDHAVLRAALATVREWRVDHPQLRLNVNLSTRHLEIPGGAAEVRAIVADSGVPPDAIDLELTERRELRAEARARAAVSVLRSDGFGVLLDDFGTGWSSLDWLLRLDISGIKVDRAVTAGLGTPGGDAAARTIAAMAHELGMDAAIEGVRTPAELQRVRAAGFRTGQGALWSMPVPAEQIAPRAAVR